MKKKHLILNDMMMDSTIKIMIQEWMTLIQIMISVKMIATMISEVTTVMSMKTRKTISEKIMIFTRIKKNRQVMMIYKKNMKVNI